MRLRLMTVECGKSGGMIAIMGLAVVPVRHVGSLPPCASADSRTISGIKNRPAGGCLTRTPLSLPIFVTVYAMLRTYLMPSICSIASTMDLL